MGGRLFNIRLDDKRYDQLRIEVAVSKDNPAPLTMTQIVKEALDLRWEHLKKKGKKQ